MIADLLQLSDWLAESDVTHVALESAGRNRSSKINQGNPYLKTALIEAAHAGARAKTTIWLLNLNAYPHGAAKNVPVSPLPLPFWSLPFILCLVVRSLLIWA
jgi:hypothetical protein